MSKPLRQITTYLEQKGFEPEFDHDSHTLFLETPTPDGPIQTRYFYDLEMEVLSCQSIFMESFPKKQYASLCELTNRFNEQLGFGAFIILEEEDLVFEINYLMEASAQIPNSILEKLSLIPSEAMMEHLPSYISVANGKTSVKEAFENFWED